MTRANPIDLHVGARLRERRLEEGKTLHGLAARILISSARLLSFEAGIERIPPETMIKLCAVLRVRPAYFFERPLNDAGGAGLNRASKPIVRINPPKLN